MRLPDPVEKHRFFQDGVLESLALPFRAGEVVEVIVLSREDRSAVRQRHSSFKRENTTL